MSWFELTVVSLNPAPNLEAGLDVASTVGTSAARGGAGARMSTLRPLGMMADGWRHVERNELGAKTGLPASAVPEPEAPWRLP